MKQPYKHPAFPQPDDSSIVLWRYMNADKFEWLISYGRIFMASVDRLGDPLEGTTPVGELEWWRRKAASTASEEHRRIVEYNRDFLSRMAKKFRKHCYASCWHINQYENHAMWKCYTNNPKAVAIRTTYETLKNCLPDYIFLGIIRYIDYAIHRLPTMNMFEYIMHKDIYYSFEREVRVVAFSPPMEAPGGKQFADNHFERENFPGFLVYAPPMDINRLIHGVVLHPEAPAKFKSRIDTMCAKSGLPTPTTSRKIRDPVF